MARKSKPIVGSVNWFDLTVKDAPGIRNFYAKVAGWKPSAFAMGGYEDYCMTTPADGKTVAGICHARGENAKLPPRWLIYITVKNLASSLKQCRALGGKVLVRPRHAGNGRIAVIRDPAGAVAALFQSE